MQLLIFGFLRQQSDSESFFSAHGFIAFSVAPLRVFPRTYRSIRLSVTAITLGLTHSRLNPFGFGGLKWEFYDHLLAFASKRPPHFRSTTLSGLVGSNGLGPSTSRLSGVCSNQLSYEPMCGGGNRIRTDDPLLAGQVLYHLSYTPVSPLTLSRLRK